jgi:type IV pilus assembly protein PilA
MRKLHTRKGGFTLIELMIVVAIIGILAAIAIPNFLMFQLRSKTGEAKTNLAAIRTAEEGYFAEFGQYVAEPTPQGGNLSSQKQLWPLTGTGFETLGWAPEGEVFYAYAVTMSGSQYTADAQGDLDADGANFSNFGYVHPVPGAVAGMAGVQGACVGGGVWDGTAQALLNSVGPCDNLSGQSNF